MHLPASNRPHPFPSPDDAEEPSESRSTRSPAMMLPPWGRPARPPRSNTPGKAVGAVTRSPGCSSPRSAEEGSTPSSGLPNRPHGTRRSSTRFAGTRGPASVKPYVVQTRRVPGPSARTAAFDTLSPPTVTSDNDRLILNMSLKSTADRGHHQRSPATMTDWARLHGRQARQHVWCQCRTSDAEANDIIRPTMNIERSLIMKYRHAPTQCTSNTHDEGR